MLTRSLRALCVAAVAAVLAVQPAGQHNVSADNFVGPKTYYLSLGDAIAFGLQQPDNDNSHGFSDDFFQYLQARGTTTLVNMGCPHETTITFMNGGCPELSMVKYSYGSDKSQLAAALDFIKAHPGQVSPVTLVIGAADVLPDITVNPSANPPCSLNYVKALLDGNTAVANFTNILTQLKGALNGSGDLITMNYFDPYQNECPTLTANMQVLNTNLQQAAQKVGVPIVDVYSAFGGPKTPNPNLCNYTWTYGCSNSSTPSVDPNTQGYQVIANAFEALVNYPATGPATATPATTAQATATAPPVVSTPGPAPATPVSQPTARPAPACSPHRGKLALSVDLGRRSVASGDILAVRIRTAPRAQVALTVQVSTTQVTVTGKGSQRRKATRTVMVYRRKFQGAADAHGQAVARLLITYEPSKKVSAVVLTTVTKQCVYTTSSGRMSILPAPIIVLK